MIEGVLFFTPLLLGSAILPPNLDTGDFAFVLGGYFKSLLAILLVVVVWSLLSLLVKRDQEKKNFPMRFREGKYLKIFNQVVMILSALLLLVALEGFRSLYERSAFITLIFYLFTSAMADAFFIRAKMRLAILFKFCSLVALSLLSFLPVTLDFVWQQILIASGISSVILAAWLIKLCCRYDLPVKRELIRLIGVMIAFSPLAFAMLVYVDLLEKNYLFLILIIFSWIRIEEAYGRQLNMQQFSRKLRAVSAFFCVAFLLIASLSVSFSHP